MSITRRKFLQNSAVAAGSFFIVPRHVLGRGYIAPSDKLNIAGVGITGKGNSDITNAFNKDVNNIVGLCDVDWKRGQQMFNRFPKAGKYKDWREMLDKQKDIDAVTISTPDHNHAAIGMAAMQLGKHVYIQKPLAHNIYETRMLTEAARRNKVVSQMGNQGASGPGVKRMAEWFDKGLIGKVHTVHVWTNRPVWPQGVPTPTGKFDVPADMDWDIWLGPAAKTEFNPAYHPFKWRGWWNFGTGALGDMGCHLIDPPYRVLGLGYPLEVEASVGSVFIKEWNPEHLPDGCPPSSNVQLKFAPTKKNKSEVIMTWNDGGIRPFHPQLIPANDWMGEPDGSNGVIMIGTKGIMTCGTYGILPKIYKKNGEKMEMSEADLNPKDEMPEHGHQYSWTEACKAGFGSDKHKALTSSFDYAGPMTETVLMGNLAIRSYGLRTQRTNAKGEPAGFNYDGRKKLIWDGVNMKITNFDEANQFVSRPYREGWKLA
jgi:predicted dehydrogenase